MTPEEEFQVIEAERLAESALEATGLEPEDLLKPGAFLTFAKELTRQQRERLT